MSLCVGDQAGATLAASAFSRSKVLSRSMAAGDGGLRDGRGISIPGGGAATRPASIASIRPLPSFESANPLGTARTRSSAPAFSGGWAAISVSASSFSTRPRGMSRAWASRSRQAARGQGGEKTLVAGAGLEALPGKFGIEAVKGGALERGDFLLDPGGTAGALKLGREKFIDHPQMGHVGERIFELALRKWAVTPVGEPRRFVDIDMGDLARQSFIGRGVP